MERKLFGLFTGRHITIVLGLAIIAPTTLGAVTAFTNVALEDPSNGHRATINTAGQLYTYNPVADPLAAYARDPNNFVQVFAEPGGSTCSTVYTVPSGKALVLTSMTSLVYAIQQPSGSTTSVVLYKAMNGFPCGARVAAATSSQPYETVPQTLGNGVALPAGTVLSAIWPNNGGSIFLYGYFAPASAVSAATARRAELTSAR